MTQQLGLSDDGLQNRIAILEGLLEKVVEVHLSTAKHVKSLDEKLNKVESSATAISGLAKKLDGLNELSATGGQKAVLDEAIVRLAEVHKDIFDIQEGLAKREASTVILDNVTTGLAEMRQEVASMQNVLAKLLEKVMDPTVAPAMAEKLDALSGVPAMFNKLESQQSNLMQAMERRIDPRLMIYLKPLIEMLEEEGRQAEEMKNAALQRLNDLMNGKVGGTNQQVSHLLQDVGSEIEKCQAAFERTQQALQIVVTPFQNIGGLFRGNLETMVQAHDLMAQLHADMPSFLNEMQQMYKAHKISTTKDGEIPITL